MEAVRSSWTDDRMDDLKGQVVELDRRMEQRFAQVDRRFAQVDQRFAQIEKRMDEGFHQVDQRMDEGFHELNLRIDALQRTMIMFGASMFAAMLGLVATQLWLVASQF
jgi:hypothetical protein